MITGATGYLGAFLVENLIKNHYVLGTSKNKEPNFYFLDITKIGSSLELPFAPNVIIHAAAISNVASCEQDPEGAYLVNVEGTKNIIKLAERYQASIIFISSVASYHNDTVYSKTKLLAENLIKQSSYGYEIIRLSMTFGLSPNVIKHRPFNKILGTINENSPIRYDDTWSFLPSSIHDLLLMVEGILLNGTKSRVTNLVTDSFCTMFEIARELIPSSTVIFKGNSYVDRKPFEIEESNSGTMTIYSSYEVMITKVKESISDYFNKA